MTSSSSSPRWRIVVGCDNAGWEYKTALIKDLEKDPRVTEVIDVGVTKDGKDFNRAYPLVGVEVGQAIIDGKADRGLLICGTGESSGELSLKTIIEGGRADRVSGMGVAMSANKVVSGIGLFQYHHVDRSVSTSRITTDLN